MLKLSTVLLALAAAAPALAQAPPKPNTQPNVWIDPNGRMEVVPFGDAPGYDPSTGQWGTSDSSINYNAATGQWEFGDGTAIWFDPATGRWYSRQ